MAYIKVKWRKDISKNQGLSAREYEKYLLKDRGSELVVDGYNCNAGFAIKQFEQTQAIYGKDVAHRSRNLNVAFEVIHSFSPEESQHLPTEKVNMMGTELAKRYFPDHQFLVVTHTDTNKTHNHILVNPVNEKTGKRDVTDKKKHLYNLRSIANDISREHGLSIIRQIEREKGKNIPQRVKEVQRRGGKSYRLDLFQKADFARSYATSFDEYVGLLSELSIHVAITEKTITYYYRGHDKGIRGKRLGAHYDKPGLIEKFKVNDELFSKRPQIRETIRYGITAFQDGEKDFMGTSMSQFLDKGNAQRYKEKNYESYTKSSRRSRGGRLPSDHALRDSILPVSEIRRASNSDILEYCKKHNIPWITNQKGDRVLKGREHVVINGNRWMNAKNRTTGSLIELVSLHDDISFLGAIAKITGNDHLLLLEQSFGEVKRSYTPFYVPRMEKENTKTAKAKVRQFFKHYKIDKDLVDDLFKEKRVHVDKKGGLWFYSDENQEAATQYTLDSKKSYQAKHYGNTEVPFIQSYKDRACVTIYTDFLNFLKANGKQSFKEKSESSLVLRGLSEKAFYMALATMPDIRRVEFIEPEDREKRIEQKTFVNRQKEKLKPFDISISTISMERAMEKNRGLDLEL